MPPNFGTRTTADGGDILPRAGDYCSPRIRRWNLRRQPEDLVLGLDCPPHVREMAKIHLAALQQYQPGIYRGAITLFTARWDQPDTPANDPTLGWAQWVEGNVDVHEIPTTHTRMLNRRHVATLARTIASHLDRVAAMPILRRDQFRSKPPHRFEPLHWPNTYKE